MAVNVSKPEINIREKLTELDKPTGAAGNAMLRANSVHDQQDLLGVGARNMIYNGDFQVWQRGTSFSTSVSNVFTADRWKVVQGDNFNYDATITRSTSAPDGYKYSLLVTTDTAQSVATGQNGGISQALEGFDVEQLGWGSSAAKDVTISFWVRSNATGLYALQLYVNRGGTTRAAYVVSYEIETSNKWEEKTIVIKGNSVRPFDAGDTGECLGIYFWHVGGSADVVSEEKWNDNTALFTSVTAHRNLFSDAGNTWQLAGVRMVVGSFPDGAPRITRPYGEELALCQRYYWQTQSYLGGDYAYDQIGQGFVRTTNTDDSPITIQAPFPVPMRVRPAIGPSTTDGAVNFVAQVGNTGATIDTIVGTWQSGVRMAWLDFDLVSNPFSVGQAVSVYCNGGSYTDIQFDAEL